MDDGDRNALDELAKTRQNFAVSPFVAWQRLDALRHRLGLQPHELPSPFIVTGTQAMAAG